MVGSTGVTLTCVECGVEFRVPRSRALTASTCSNECGYKRRGKSRSRKVTLTCKHCELPFEVPQCHKERRVFCSVICMEASASIRSLKSSRVGVENPSWKGGVVQRDDGYLYESAYGHPCASPSNYVLQHRLVMERWLLENVPQSRFLITLCGQRVLSPEFEVHHRNEVRDDNRIENLQCMTPAEHKRHHHKLAREAARAIRQNGGIKP